MKIVVDMGLSPAWRSVFEQNGIEAFHWSEIGNPKAKDREILAWARENRFVVFTHDLDFGHLLALTHASGPSVIQVRSEDVLPESGESLKGIWGVRVSSSDRAETTCFSPTLPART